MYFNSILNEYYDTIYIDDSILNLSLMICSESKDDAIEIIDANKNNFSSLDKYNETKELIEKLDSSKELDYYLKLVR